MKPEDKDLLLKDLCTRLSYGIKVQYYDYENERFNYDVAECIYVSNREAEIGVGQYGFTIDKIKPYLFPLLSMTEEQKIECFKGTPLEIDKYGYIEVKDDSHGNSLYTDLEIYLEVIDWLNKNHFDYRGLIKKSLAIDATNLNVY